MTKRDQLHQWLLEKADWVYLREVPFKAFGMTRATCSSELRALCEFGRADFRIICNKQYKAKPVEAPRKGPKQSRWLT